MTGNINGYLIQNSTDYNNPITITKQCESFQIINSSAINCTTNFEDFEAGTFFGIVCVFGKCTIPSMTNFLSKFYNFFHLFIIYLKYWTQKIINMKLNSINSTINNTINRRLFTCIPRFKNWRFGL